ncbi:MAG: hypothetical protein ACK4FF_05570 [Limnobacter sp.]|uniref:hypothetical protein n=1 Tax=Limnobacter sp. TaxID=2003368 RepID=UPI00391D8025
MTIKLLDLKKLNLDLSNPRIGTFENEQAVIEALLKDEKILPLAKDIAKKGMTNPLDFIGVFPAEASGKYVVAEGNRRVCALKLLDKPELAGTSEQVKKFQTLKTSMVTRISKIEVRIFPDRESANVWIPLRHLGSQDGKGLKAWDTVQKARYLEELGTRDSPDRLAKYLIEYATTNELLTDDQLDQVPVTTITRYVSNPIMRNALGLTNAKPPEITVPENLFKAALKHFLLDSIGQDPRVNSRSKKAQIDAYANELLESGVAPTVRNQASKPLAAKPNQKQTEPTEQPSSAPGENVSTQVTAQTAKQARNNRNPLDRKHIVPNDFRIRVKPDSLKLIYDEMRSIDVEECPLSAVALFRGFLECALKKFINAHEGKVKDDLSAKMNEAATIMEGLGHKLPGIENLKNMAQNRQMTMSAYQMGRIVHGAMGRPNKRYINSGWTQIEDIIPILLTDKK